MMVMDENLLLDSFSASGDDLKDLENAIQQLEECTSFQKETTERLQVLSLFADDDEKIYCYKLDPGQPSRDIISYLQSGRALLRKDNFRKKGSFEDIIEEAVSNTRLMLSNGKHVYFTSSHVTSTMDAFGINGAFLNTPCIERDLVIAKQFQEDRECTLVVRSVNGVKKVFAILGSNYGVFPQSALLDLIHAIETRCNVGSIKCRSWNITNFMSSVFIEFPDIGAQFQTAYGLSEEFVPGIWLATSDTGDSSFKIRGTWRVDNSVFYNHEIKRRHTGEMNTDDMLEEIEETIIQKYQEFIEKVCGLRTSIVTKTAHTKQEQSQNAKNIESVIKSCFKQIKITGAIGKKASCSILKNLVDSFNNTTGYMAYDIAVGIMKIPQQVGNLNIYAMEELQKVIHKAPYINYGC